MFTKSLWVHIQNAEEQISANKTFPRKSVFAAKVSHQTNFLHSCPLWKCRPGNKFHLLSFLKDLLPTLQARKVNWKCECWTKSRSNSGGWTISPYSPLMASSSGEMIHSAFYGDSTRIKTTRVCFVVKKRLQELSTTSLLFFPRNDHWTLFWQKRYFCEEMCCFDMLSQTKMSKCLCHGLQAHEKSDLQRADTDNSVTKADLMHDPFLSR